MSRSSSVVRSLAERKQIQPPKFVPDGICYETLMGSMAYGVESETSDWDIYGFCLPPKEMVFPHLAGEITGFGRQIKRFEQFQQHHILDPAAAGGSAREYDLTVYSIVRYFQLAMENNPNIIDSLFTPNRCVLHITAIGTMVRENRRLFLHRGAWHKFKGYAYAQVHKMESKSPEEGSKRRELVERFGFDVKFAYHVVRLLDEVEQILTEGDIDLERNREQLKAIRRGDWTEQDVRDHFSRKERELEALYTSSTLRHGPDEARIKQLLLDCLEQHYGSLSGAITVPGADRETLRQIKDLCEKAGV